jgi:exosome complex exonuclease RRP6
MYLDAYSNSASTSEFKIQVQTPASPKKPKAAIPADIFHASTLPKPQLKFQRKPDNSLDTPWMPPIHQKPNAQVPLDVEFTSPHNLPASFQFPHPYRHEIAHISYPENLFHKSEPISYRSFEETPVHWVATPKDLEILLHDLKTVNEFAVDLEHHDYRSYGGFLCLMQISTRKNDYIVDTLLLREELQVLNEVFTDSTITKVR